MPDDLFSQFTRYISFIYLCVFGCTWALSHSCIALHNQTQSRYAPLLLLTNSNLITWFIALYKCVECISERRPESVKMVCWCSVMRQGANLLICGKHCKLSIRQVYSQYNVYLGERKWKNKTSHQPHRHVGAFDLIEIGILAVRANSFFPFYATRVCNAYTHTPYILNWNDRRHRIAMNEMEIAQTKTVMLCHTQMKWERSRWATNAPHKHTLYISTRLRHIQTSYHVQCDVCKRLIKRHIVITHLITNGLSLGIISEPKRCSRKRHTTCEDELDWLEQFMISLQKPVYVYRIGGVTMYRM